MVKLSLKTFFKTVISDLEHLPPADIQNKY